LRNASCTFLEYMILEKLPLGKLPYPPAVVKAMINPPDVGFGLQS